MALRDAVCCQELPRVASAAQSPFGRIISLGFYDGTTSGIARCSHCSKSYKYDLVAWDGDQDIRVFSLSALPPESFAALEVLLSQLKSRFVDSDDPKRRTIVKTAVGVELAKAEAPTLVLATRRFEQEILAARPVTIELRNRILVGGVYPTAGMWDFWSDYLSIGRSQKGPH